MAEMRSKIAKLSSEQIITLLTTKHEGDVFIAECKNGSTHMANHLRLDAWAMPKSWAPWTTIGYEVKVSRADFERDQKWPSYVAYCHQFSIVCPGGLIKVQDLPTGVGLLWVSANGERLHTKLRAERHEPDPVKLCQLLSYALMNRSRIVANMYEANNPPPEPVDRLESWRQTVVAADARHELASFIRGHVRRVYDQLVDRELAVELSKDQVTRFSKQLARLGVQWNPEDDDWRQRSAASTQLEALFEGVNPGVLREMRELAGRLTKTADVILQLKTQAETREGEGA